MKLPQSMPRKSPPDPGEVVGIVGPPAPGLKEPKGLLPETINEFSGSLIDLANMDIAAFVHLIVFIFMK